MFQDDDTMNPGMNGGDDTGNGGDTGAGEPSPTEGDTATPDTPAS